MKKLLLIALCFVLVGCQGGVNNPGETNFDDLGVEKSFDNEGEGRELIDTEEDDLTLMEKYAKWSLDLESDNGQLVVSQLQEDCFVSDFWNPKGDLLSTIVANNRYFQDNYDVNVYRDIDYLIELDKKVIDVFSERNWNNFNMSFVCNLGEKIDLVYGSSGMGEYDYMYIINNDNVIDMGENWYDKWSDKINDAKTIASVGPILNSSPAGDVPDPCKIDNIDEDSFDINCFYRYGYSDGAGEPYWSEIVFTVSFEGDVVDVYDEAGDIESLPEKYKQWSLSSLETVDEIDGIGENCFVNTDPWANDGDLLSTMISDRRYLLLYERYYGDKDYLKELDKIVVAKFKEKHNSNFNMHLVCNLADKVELLAGMSDYDGSGVPGMYLVNDGEIIEVADSEYVLGSAKHGPSMCSISSVESKSFVWDCDGGFLYEGEVVVGTKYDRYKISFDGEVLSEESIEEIR